MFSKSTHTHNMLVYGCIDRPLTASYKHIFDLYYSFIAHKFNILSNNNIKYDM